MITNKKGDNVSKKVKLTAVYSTPSKKEIFKILTKRGIDKFVADSSIKKTAKSKDVMIRDIQRSEGNSACFKCISECGITDCLWFHECQR